MPIYRTARYTIKSGSVENIRQLLQEYVTQVRQNEPGTLFYIVMQDRDDPSNFTHFGIYKDAAAQEAHNHNAKHYADQLWAETTAPATFIDYELVASNDG